MRLRLPWQSLVLSTPGRLIARVLCMPLQAARLLPPWALAGVGCRGWRPLPSASAAGPDAASCRHPPGWTELQSRIRPHFPFNTLNTAGAHRPAKSESVLKIYEPFRVALESTKARPSARLKSCCAGVQRYLAIEELRLASG